jgi:hypothetical protein
VRGEPRFAAILSQRFAPNKESGELLSPSRDRHAALQRNLDRDEYIQADIAQPFHAAFLAIAASMTGGFRLALTIRCDESDANPMATSPGLA